MENLDIRRETGTYLAKFGSFETGGYFFIPAMWLLQFGAISKNYGQFFLYL